MIAPLPLGSHSYSHLVLDLNSRGRLFIGRNTMKYQEGYVLTRTAAGRTNDLAHYELHSTVQLSRAVATLDEQQITGIHFCHSW